MLVVRTSVRPSPIHGLGVFAKEPIRRGETIWVFDPTIDSVLSEAALETYPAHLVDYVARDIAPGEEITCDHAVIRCRKHTRALKTAALA